MTTDYGAVEAGLAYSFTDKALLARALTHTSATARARDSYQRMEFLGDRVLAIVVADMLYRSYPAADEGELARRLNAMVKRETCAQVARTLGLGEAVRLGAGENTSGGRDKVAILADVMESVIAAVYLDGGLPAARAVVEREWAGFMIAPTAPMRDAKTMLQEWLQGMGLPAPRYGLVERTGPDHDPRFTIEVDMGSRGTRIAHGRSKREAEQAAAQAALIAAGVWTSDEGHNG